MYKILTIICLVFLLNIQAVYSEVIPISDLDEIEQNLGIKVDNPAILPRIDTIERALYGNTYQDSIPNRINHIKNSLNPQTTTKPIFNFLSNPDVGNYYTETCDKNIPKWKNFPVTVYIGNVPEKYRLTVVNALNQWKSFFPLELSDNKNSNIDIVWVNRLSSVNPNETPLGRTNYKYSNNNSEKGKIEILNKNKYLPSELEEILLHEIGHAIGLGHSPNIEDIMYPKLRAQRGGINSWSLNFIGYIPLVLPNGYQQNTPGRTIITQRDINTLSRVYSGSQDIYSVNYVTKAKQLPNPSSQEDLNDYLKTANDYYTKGNYNSALDYYKKILEVTPDNVIINGNVGCCYNLLNEYDKALEYLKKSLSLNPNNAITYINCGYSYKGKGLYKEAIESYNKALAITQDDRAYSNLASVYISLGNYDAAIINCNKAIEINSKNISAYNNLGAAYSSKRQYKQAADCYKKALSIDPDYDLSRQNLDNLYKNKLIKK
ncbi:MAG: tetratricopeptide repeat protein [bacterium]